MRVDFKLFQSFWTGVDAVLRVIRCVFSELRPDVDACVHEDDVFEHDVLAFRQTNTDDRSIVAQDVNIFVHIFLLENEAWLYQWTFNLVNSLAQENRGVRFYVVKHFVDCEYRTEFLVNFDSFAS